MNAFFDKLKLVYTTDVQPVLHNEVVMISLAILLLLSLWILLKIRSRLRAMRIFKTQSGRVMVSRGALRDLVHSASRQVVTTNKFRVSFFAKRGKLHLTLKLKLNEGQRVNDVASRLEARIKEVLQETLSIEKIGTINVIITGFAKSKHVAPAPVMVTEQDEHTLHEVSPVKPEEDQLISTEEDPEEDKPVSNPVLVSDAPKTPSDEDVSDEDDEPEEKPKERRTFSFFGHRKSDKSGSEEPEASDVNGAEAHESEEETKEESDEEPKTAGFLGEPEQAKKD